MIASAYSYPFAFSARRSVAGSTPIIRAVTARPLPSTICTGPPKPPASSRHNAALTQEGPMWWLWFDRWVPPSCHDVITVDFAKKRVLGRAAN